MTAILTALTTMASLVFAGWGVWAAERALRDQQIASAWQILALPGEGVTGKAYAIEVLLENGQRLFDIDLSCGGAAGTGCTRLPNYGYMRAVGMRDPSEDAESLQTLLFGVSFARTRLVSALFEDLVIVGGDFDGAFMDKVDFRNVWLSDSSFRGTQLVNASFNDGGVFNLDFTDAKLMGVDFTGDGIHGPFNISGATICEPWPNHEPWCAKVTQQFFDVAWFYADNPPKGLHLLSSVYRLNRGCASGPRRHPWHGGDPPFYCADYVNDRGIVPAPSRPPR